MPVAFANVTTSRAGQRSLVFPPSEIPKIRAGWNSRFALDTSAETLRGIEELAHSIAGSSIGQIEPVVIRKGEGGEPYLIAGNRRRAAVQYINDHIDLFRAMYPHVTGEYALKAVIVDCSEDEAIEANLAENLDKLALSPIDKACAVRDLEKRGWDNARIAKALRCSTTYLPTLRGYLSLPKEAQQKLHDGVLTGDLASSLVGLPDDAIKETVSRVVSGALKPAQAKREVNGRKRESGVKVRRTAKEIQDELAPLAEEFMLASALSEYMAGNSRFLSLRALIREWDPGMRAGEDEEVAS